MKKTIQASGLFLLLVAFLFSCSGKNNSPGPDTNYSDIRDGQAISDGDVGIDSSNISEVSDQMARDMLANPMIARTDYVPKVILDSEYFYNDSSNILDKNLITDKLRIELMRASGGKLLFVGRHFSGMVEKERELKREGYLQPGNAAAARAQLGGDFRMGGRIKSLDRLDPATGKHTRYTQITMEMVDLETGALVWSNIYEYRKGGSGILPIYR